LLRFLLVFFGLMSRQVVEACLAFDPDQRQTPAGLAHALQTVLAELPTADPAEALHLQEIATHSAVMLALREQVDALRKDVVASRQERDSAVSRLESKIAWTEQERDAIVTRLQRDLSSARGEADLEIARLKAEVTASQKERDASVAAARTAADAARTADAEMARLHEELGSIRAASAVAPPVRGPVAHLLFVVVFRSG
jgi:hypothetical protein